jgi:outer membrane protein OmpA-like peptidoglycan-associated protein
VVAPPPRNDLFVVVPDRDGKAGAITVTTPQGGQEVLDRPYAGARLRTPGRLEPTTVTAEEVRQTFDPALTALPLRPVSFRLYFNEGTDELTAGSRQEIAGVFAEIARRPAETVEVVVIGHTDRMGTMQFNDALSRQRAERVRTELVRLGASADRITIAGRGEREPLVPTDDEVAEPRNRRVEITIR